MGNVDPQHPGSQHESTFDDGSESEHAGSERNDGGPEQEGSENRPLREMEKPYHGPEEGGGISTHGLEGETDLRRAKEYAEMIVDTVREGLLVLNFDLRIEAANESFYRLFEADPEETEGHLIFDLGNGQWDIPELRTLLEKILPERKVMTGFEVTHEFKDIGRRVMRLNARQLDHHQRILLSIEDVTEKEKAEERLRASEKKLRDLNRSLEKRVRKRTAELRKQTERLRHMAAELASAEQRERRRLASLLHDDLQQLLYGAKMKLGNARGKREQDAAAIEETSEQINKALESARSLTEQLRPPALYEAGLAPALEWLASDMVERNGLEVTLDTGDGIESGRAESVFNDDIKAMLYECARELLFNVVKHAGVSEAHVGLRIDPGSEDADQRAEEGPSGGRLRLVVEDEGRGFEVDRAFESAAEEGGFGLLSIRERIAALGGSTEIDSRPGNGTRVVLTVPLTALPSDEDARPFVQEPSAQDPPTLDPPDLESPAPAEAPGENNVQERPLEGGATGESQAGGTPPPSPVRVAVADDHAVVREGIANLLAYDERTTVAGEAADGREAIDLVEKERPDVVLMDVNMPEMNGVEATREISSHWPETAVIGISVQDDRATERSMLEAGAEAFAPKSGDTDQIINTILKVCGRNSQSGI